MHRRTERSPIGRFPTERRYVGLWLIVERKSAAVQQEHTGQAPRARLCGRSLDYPVRAREHSLRDLDTKRFGSFQIDEQLELGGLLDRKISGLCALEYLVHENGGAAEVADQVRAV